MRGRFIALEGLDGSGTTTQAARLVDALHERGRTVLRTQEPSHGPIGRLVREQLRRVDAPIDPDALALLFAADRCDHVITEIEPALARGTDVVCDRYVLSSWVYQGLASDPAWVRTINARAPWPDLTLVLDLPAAQATRRVHARGGEREIFDALALQERVEAGYRDALARAEAVNTVRIDARGSIDEVAAAVLAGVLQGWLANPRAT
jgi:dTMP kinase